MAGAIEGVTSMYRRSQCNQASYVMVRLTGIGGAHCLTTDRTSHVNSHTINFRLGHGHAYSSDTNFHIKSHIGMPR